MHKSLKTFLKALFSFGLLALVFYFVPVSDVWHALSETAWQWVALSFFFSLIVNYLNALQMHIVTWHLQLTLSTWQIFKVNLITKFYSLFLPGYLAGGAIRWYHFQKQDSKPTEALAAIVLNRLLETSLTVGLGVGFWLLDQDLASAQIGVTPLIVFGLLFVALYLVSFNRWTHLQMNRLFTWLLPASLSGRLKRLLQALGAYEDLPLHQHYTVLGLAVFRHALGICAMYMLAIGLNLNLSPETIGWVRSVVTLAMMLPFTIGGFGVRELTFIGLLVPLGIDSADALSLSLLVFATSLVYAAVGGLLEGERLLSRRRV